VEPCEHIVQLFDDTESLADSLARFLREGFEREETTLVVAGANQWSSTVKRFADHPARLSRAMATGQLIVLDSVTSLDRLRPEGRLSHARFDEVVGALVRQLCSRGRPLRVYGEMVDLLALEGDFEAARRLEGLWNELALEQSFTLFCGYSAVHFGDPTSAPALMRICRSHTLVRVDARDMLATFLLQPASPDLVS
jgi:MEDS: MEthanogen/methylotroph, DcmR Sensory domain